MIRDDDEYGGYRVSLEAVLETIITPMQVDITTGDAITPKEILYSFKTIFDDRNIEIWAYNIETVLAEKFQTILRRGIFNTRPRDYYDIFVLIKTQEFNKELFVKAFYATVTYRDTVFIISNINKIINEIEISDVLKNMWNKYSKEYFYAKDISFAEVTSALRELDIYVADYTNKCQNGG